MGGAGGRRSTRRRVEVRRACGRGEMVWPAGAEAWIGAAVSPSDALVDDVAIGGGHQARGEAEQAVEGGAGVAPAVEAEDEIVEIALQMPSPEAVKGTEPAALQVQEHAMHRLDDAVCGHLADDLAVVIVPRQAHIALPDVGDHRGTWGGGVDEGGERRRREIGDRRQPDPPRLARRRQLDGTGDRHLADRAATTAAVDRVVLAAQGDLGLVDLDQGLQLSAVGIDHRPTQTMQEKPSRLVAAEAELGLQLQRRDAVGMAGDDVRGEQPRAQRQVAAVHDGARRHRGLLAAAGALKGRPWPPQPPALAAAAVRADEAVGPAPLDEVTATGRLVGKPRLERGARHRTFGFPAARHE